MNANVLASALQHAKYANYFVDGKYTLHCYMKDEYGYKYSVVILRGGNKYVVYIAGLYEYCITPICQYWDEKLLKEDFPTSRNELFRLYPVQKDNQ